MRATGTESAVSITRAVTKQRIGLRLDFDDRLDADRLERAVRLSLGAEPLLGCSFRTRGWRPSWEPIPDLDGSRPFALVQTDDPDGAMVVFQASEVPDAGPQVAVSLFRGTDADVLGIKLSHILADGQAAKQYAYLLADIHARLVAEPFFTPEPNLAPRPTGRDVWDRLAPDQRREAAKAKSWANPNWDIPAKASTGDGMTYLTLALSPREFRTLKSYGKARDATVNDMMLAAVFRACVREFDPPSAVPLSLMCTADLRRFLPDAERLPLANISISGSLGIARVDGEAFDGTLARVRERMGAWAKACYGAGPAANAERLAALGYPITKALLGATFRLAGGSGKSYPWFTNIGVIDDSRLSFDGAVPVAGHVFGPAAIGASIVPVISTCCDILTVCMGFCESDFDAVIVRRVLDGIRGDLAEGAGIARDDIG